MQNIEVEKIVVIAGAIIICLFIGGVLFTSETNRVTQKQMYDACLAKGGSWIPQYRSDGICIQRGSF